MKMSLTLEQIESGKCPCCGGQWDGDKCKCCGASTRIDDGRIMLMIPHEGCIVLARVEDGKVR